MTTMSPSSVTVFSLQGYLLESQFGLSDHPAHLPYLREFIRVDCSVLRIVLLHG